MAGKRIRDLDELLTIDPADWDLVVDKDLAPFAKRVNGDVFGSAIRAAGPGIVVAAPTELVVSGSPVHDGGTVGLAWRTQPANVLFAGPASGSPAVPTFRALVESDLPLHAMAEAVSLFEEPAEDDFRDRDQALHAAVQEEEMNRIRDRLDEVDDDVRMLLQVGPGGPLGSPPPATDWTYYRGTDVTPLTAVDKIPPVEAPTLTLNTLSGSIPSTLSPLSVGVIAGNSYGHAGWDDTFHAGEGDDPFPNGPFGGPRWRSQLRPDGGGMVLIDLPQSAGAEWYDVYASIDGTPKFLARVTESQRAAGCVITDIGTVTAGASPEVIELDVVAPDDVETTFDISNAPGGQGINDAFIVDGVPSIDVTGYTVLSIMGVYDDESFGPRVPYPSGSSDSLHERQASHTYRLVVFAKANDQWTPINAFESDLFSSARRATAGTNVDGWTEVRVLVDRLDGINASLKVLYKLSP